MIGTVYDGLWSSGLVGGQGKRRGTITYITNNTPFDKSRNRFLTKTTHWVNWRKLQLLLKQARIHHYLELLFHDGGTTMRRRERGKSSSSLMDFHWLDEGCCSLVGLTCEIEANWRPDVSVAMSFPAGWFIVIALMVVARCSRGIDTTRETRSKNNSLVRVAVIHDQTHS